MPPLTSASASPSVCTTAGSFSILNSTEQDIWFDAIDHIEMDESWFDASDTLYPDPASAEETADSRVPFTEDCRRGAQQLIRILGNYKENELLSACLSKMLPGTPVSLVMAANNLYTAITEQRNIDTAALHALGLASWCLPEDINVFSRLATFIRDTIIGWTEETFLSQFTGEEGNFPSANLFTALAVTAIVAGRWMQDEGAPQRRLLKVPAFVANFFIRASHYWAALGNMASSGYPPAGNTRRIPESPQQAPAFEVDTSVEMTGDTGKGHLSCPPSALRVTAFSSNSTITPEAFTRATIPDKPAPTKSARLSVPEQVHALAVGKLRQESGIRDLLYCATQKIETRQQVKNSVITNIYLNTKCDATAHPAPLTKESGPRYSGAANEESAVLTSAGADDSAIEMTSLMLPLTLAAMEAQVAVPVAGISPRLKVAGTLGAAAVVATAGGFLTKYLLSGKGAQSSAPEQAYKPHNEIPGVPPLNESDVIHATPASLPPPAAAALVDENYPLSETLPQNEDNDTTDYDSFPGRGRRHLDPGEKKNTPTARPDNHDVKIEKMYDFSCLTTRNDMTFADSLRAFGQALTKPIDSMAKESQVVHSMNTKGEACPGPESIEELEKFTKPIDMAISSIISIVPIFRFPAILQNLVGPIAEMIADDLQGKDVDLHERSNAALQMADMIRMMFASLKPEETLNMNKEPDGNTGLKESIKKRVTIEDGETYVTVGGKKNALHLTKKEGMPYIQDDESGEIFFIKFNKKTEQWDKVDKNSLMGGGSYYDEYGNNQEKIKKYGIEFDENLPDITLELVKNENVPEFYLLRTKNNVVIKGVFIQNAFIPANYLNVNGGASGKWVMATLPVGGRSVVLEHTDYGWRFERKSSGMDESTRIFLDAPGRLSGRSFESKYNKFTPLDRDGLCQDHRGNTYLKKDDKYYQLDAYEGGFNFHDSPSTIIEKKEGVFILKTDEEMLLGREPVLVGAIPGFHSGSVKRIEAEAEHYLVKYAEKETRRIARLPPVSPGVYRLNSGSDLAFLTETAQFKTVKVTDEYIDIQRTGGGKITLKLMGDVYVRQRDEKYGEEFGYEQISTCRTKRAPGEGACDGLPVMIEDTLRMALDRFIKIRRRDDINLTNHNLVEDKMVPGGVIYKDRKTNKSYFMHKGKFFEATILSSKDRDNPTGKTNYKIWGKRSFFHQREYIDTVVIEQLSDQIKIMPHSVYMAEQLNVSADMASGYIKASKYRYYGGVRDIEDAVNLVRTAGEFYVAPIPKSYAPEFTTSAIEKTLSSMYPERIRKSGDYVINVYGLTDNTMELTDYQKRMQVYFKEKVKSLRKYFIPIVMVHTKFDGISQSAEVRNYLNQIFGYPGDKFLNDFEYALYRLGKRMLSALSEDKIKIVSLSLKNEGAASRDTIQEGEVLTADERASGLAAFMAADRKGVMYINADKIYAMPGESYQPGADLMTILIHELSHAEKMTTDYVYIPRTADGKYIPTLDAVQHVIDKVSQWDIVQSGDFKKRTNEYFKNIAVYKGKLSANLEGKLAYVAENDPGFLGHILLNNADTVSMMYTDIFNAMMYDTSIMRPSSSEFNIKKENKYSVDQFGTVYKSDDGNLIKEYNSKSGKSKDNAIFTDDDRYFSNTGIAMNNARCLNAIFGDGTAVVAANTNDYTVRLKFRRVPGEAVIDIIGRSKDTLDKTYKNNLLDMLSSGKHPADKLTEKLVNAGVIVHDTAINNLFFDKNDGFYFFNYDTADIWPDKTKIPASQISRMNLEIKKAVADFARRMDLNDDVIMLSSAINDVEQALKLTWFRNKGALDQVKTLQLVTERALHSQAITPNLANRFSAWIWRIREKSVDNIILALAAKKKHYSENPMTSDEELNQLVLKSIQNELDIVGQFRQILNKLGERLKRVSLNQRHVNPL